MAGSRKDKKVRIGIIGTGSIANAHAFACSAIPNVEIVALADIAQGAAESFSDRHGIDAPIFSNHHDLLAMGGLDAVTVCTPNDVHAPISIDAIKAGKHVLCEKPMSASIADAKAMVVAARKSKVRTMTGYTKRFFKGSRFLHDLLRREDLGRVFHIRACYLQSWLSNPNTPIVWRLEQNRTGSGVLGDLGSHITDLAQFIMGDTITRVNGMMKTFTSERPTMTGSRKKQKVDVDDACMFGAEFESGAMGVFEAPRNATGHPDYWRIEIDAEKGAVSYDNVDGRVLHSTQDGPARHAGWVELNIPNRYGARGREFQNEVNHFVECITNKETPVPSFEEAFKTERVLDAVVRSSQKGKAVDVET